MPIVSRHRPRLCGKVREKVRSCNGGASITRGFSEPPIQIGSFWFLWRIFRQCGRQEAASSNGQDAAPSRLRWEFDSPRCYQVMNTQTIELDGFEIELASELYCDRGGDHHDLADRARTDRRRLGQKLDESGGLCVKCMKAIPLKA